jgi:U3 small nucleolar RNA-associated protein 22
MSSSPKRRKLEHKSAEANTEENFSDSDQNDHSSEESADEPVLVSSKQTPLRAKLTQGANDAALYAGGSYRSSLFKLQVDELLAEVQPNYEKRLSGVNEALRRLKTLLEGIEDCDPISVSPFRVFSPSIP